ncbi:MAG: TonB-dependent receptor [Imperialibacter sp.]
MRQRLLKYVFPVVCLVALTFGQALAQDRQVSGKVTDAESGEGLPGVNILEAGTSNGTVTDINGNYTISVGANASISFSFVGYTPQVIAVGSSAVIDAALELDVQSLSEVVVVGYGTQDKKEITSSVTSVKAEDFNKGTVNSPAQLLQGKVAGLNVVRPGGDPNGGFKIRLRGVSTVGANAEPLVVIDGVIGGSLNTVDPNDIASIDVLKDGSAAAIYGTRGSSGVILITTKTGKAGKVSVEYNGSIAMENVARTIPVMDAAEYKKLPGAIDLGSDTDWLDILTRTAYSQVHNLSLGGGTSSTTYRASLNVRDAEGVGINSGFQQLNGRLNLTQKALNDKAVFTVNISSTSKDATYGDANSFRYGIITNPTMPIYDNTTTSPTAGGNFAGYAERDIFDWYNPLSIAEQNIHDGKDTRLLTSIRGEYNFTSNFRTAVFYSRQWESDWRGNYSPKTAKFGGGFGRSGLADISRNDRFNELFETTVNYDITAGDANIALLGGYSYQDFQNEGNFMQGGNFLTDAFTYNNMGAALDFANGLGSISSYKNSNKLVAFFGRANMNYQGTYFLSASARYEGSTRFGANNKWGLFPAVSGGVTLSNLFDLPGVNSLKFRASWGITGNQPGSSYASLQRFGRQGNFFIDGAYVPSYGPVSNANPDLAWETKNEIDFGLDFAALDSRLTGTLDFYKRNTKDLILQVTVPVPPNLFGSTLVNIGELENIGFEAAFNYAAVNTSDFSWTPGINFSTFSTTVVSLTSGDLSFGSGGVLYRANMGSPGQNATNLVRVKEGEKLGQLWGPVQVGILDNGTPEFKDIDGDGTFCDCDDDRTVVGNGLPDFTFGFNNSFTYKNFDINLFFRGAVGHELYNSYRGFYENTQGTTTDNYNVVNTKYFDPEIKDAKVNSSHVEKADFIKLDNATVGYRVNLAPGSAFSNFRVYLSAQNPFVVTGYTGIDPEVRFVDSFDDSNDGNDDPLAPGVERRVTYFTTRVFTFGINLGF